MPISYSLTVAGFKSEDEVDDLEAAITAVIGKIRKDGTAVQATAQRNVTAGKTL